MLAAVARAAAAEAQALLLLPALGTTAAAAASASASAHQQQQRAAFAAKASSSGSSTGKKAAPGAAAADKAAAASTSAPAAPAAAAKGAAKAAADSLVAQKDWAAVKLPPQTPAGGLPTATYPGQAFLGDLRSTSGLGLGDGVHSHTGKWLDGAAKSPLQYIQEAEPILVEGAVVASYGSEDPALGCPVEYINLKGTSKENPAVCKYTGNKYYSLTWRSAH